MFNIAMTMSPDVTQPRLGMRLYDLYAQICTYTWSINMQVHCWLCACMRMYLAIIDRVYVHAHIRCTKHKHTHTIPGSSVNCQWRGIFIINLGTKVPKTTSCLTHLWAKAAGPSPGFAGTRCNPWWEHGVLRWCIQFHAIHNGLEKDWQTCAPYAYLFICMYVCIFVYLYVCAGICMCMHVCVHGCLSLYFVCVHVFVCVSASQSLSRSVGRFTCTCDVCVTIRVCVSVQEIVCKWLFVCVG